MLKKDYEDILKGVNSMDGDKGWKIIEQEKSKLEIEYRLNHQKMYQNALNRNHSKTKGQLYSSEDYFIPAQNSDHS